MKKQTASAIMVLIAILLSIPAMAHGPNAFGARGGCGHIERGERIGLTQEQITRISDLRKDFMDRAKGIREKMRTRQGEMNALLRTGNPDGARLKKMQAEINRLYAEIADARIDHILEVKKVDPRACPGYGMHGKHGLRPGKHCRNSRGGCAL